MRIWKGREGEKKEATGHYTAGGNEAASGTKCNSKILSLNFQKKYNYMNRNEGGGKFGKVIESV